MRLEMGLSQKLQLQQKLVLAPQIIQSIEILQFPSVNLLDYVEQQLGENEALEIETIEETPPAPVEADQNGQDRVLEHEPAFEYNPDAHEEFKPRRLPRGERDGKLEALMNTAGRPATLQDLLVDQLVLSEASPHVLELARILIYNLDDDGYLAPHRFVTAVLEATDEQGDLLKPLADVVAEVDGVAAVRVPTGKRGVTADQVAAAQAARDRHVLELQDVLARVDRIRSAPGGAGLTAREVLLRYPLVELIERESGDWTLEDAEAALRVVQSLDPRGVAGRTLEETLVLQLDEDDLLYAEKRLLLWEHLDHLRKNRLQKVAREMGIDIDEVQMLIDELKGLHPKPGARLAPSTADAVHPDVVIAPLEDGDGFRIELVNSYLPPLRVSSEYVRLAGDTSVDQETREHARRKVEGARWLIDAILQRQSTLTRVTERIFHHQHAFLLHGEDALRPLKMQTVADALDIHVSTVSRAIADKWVQTSRGIYPLKFFFTGGTETASGGVESRHSVKNRVKAIIDAEDASSPLSDDDVAARLKEQGLSIARRTVTKYRKQLGIPSSRQRRRWS
jgi:RNA polymerase sigma-54 factor